MRLLSNLKVRTKLLFLLSIMIVGMLFVGINGFRNTVASQTALKDMYTQSLVSIELLGSIQTEVSKSHANTLRLIISNSEFEKSNVKKDLDKCLTILDDTFKNYENTQRDSFEKKNYTMFQEDFKKWKEYVSQIYDLVKSGSQEEALDKYSSAKLLVKGMESTVKDLIDYKRKSGDVIYKNSLNEEEISNSLLILALICTLVICSLLNLIIIFNITRPVAQVVTLLKKTADFDLVNDNSYDSLLKRKDEMGMIIKSAADMRASLRNIVGKLHTIANNLAADSVELNAATDENAKTINQVVATINDIAQGNNSQADSVNKASLSISDITYHIEEVGKVTHETVTSADQSLEMVAEGQQAVILTVDKMNENITISNDVNESLTELTESISKVGSISDLINSISAQTNLLSLNAAIEAARAGSAGKGFAVVAEEIRKLADESSSAAKEIAAIIKDTIIKNTAASQNVEKSKEIIKEQTYAVNVTKEAFEKIKLSVEGITHSIQNAAQMLDNIDSSSKAISSHTQDMAALAEQAAASSEEISASSEEQLASIEMISKAAYDLSGMAAELNNELRKFKL